PTALAKLRRELAESREALGQARASVAGAAAAALLAGDADPIVRVFDDLPIEGVRMVAKRVTEAGRVAVLGAAGPAGVPGMPARPGVGRRGARRRPGRGGGRPGRRLAGGGGGEIAAGREDLVRGRAARLRRNSPPPR